TEVKQKLSGLGIPNKKKDKKFVSSLEDENISEISKNITSSQNCETNLLINENLSRISSSMMRNTKTNIKDDEKELENMKSVLIQYCYINSMLEDTYSKQKNFANVYINANIGSIVR